MDVPLRVLLVEDSEDDAILLLRALKKSGYLPECLRVELASEFTAALANQTWDIVLSDYTMPEFSALQALELLQAQQQDLPFIVVSGVMGEESAVAIMKAGAHDYLLKDRLLRLGPAIERELREAEVRRSKREAEEALLRAYENLESQVQERTAQIKATNLQLRAEIEERERIESVLRQLAAIVESSLDAIISTDLDGTILSWNAGAEAVYGYGAAEAIGHKLQQLLTPSDPQVVQRFLGDRLRNDDDPRQVIHQRKDGRAIEVFLTVSPVRDAAGETVGVSTIARDISERRAVERLKDEFVSIVSHELRTPLTSIRGSLGLLLSGKLGSLTEQGQRFLEIAINNTDRLVRLIEDILDLERLESGQVALELQPHRLADLMREAIEIVQPVADKTQVKIVPEFLDVTLRVDGDRLVQAMVNLLSNAVKFSPNDSQVQLRATYVPEAPAEASEVVVAIIDHGRGIPADKLETIFGRFQQVDASDARQKGGTGLGLAICQSIIEQHHGRLWVESVQGEGSTFYFALPLDASDLANPLTASGDVGLSGLGIWSPRLAEGSGALSDWGARQILLVEDNADLARVLAATFAGHGIQACVAPTGPAAIAACQVQRPDLIVLDLMLSEGNGFGVVDWLRQQPELCQTSLIVYSAKDLAKRDRARLTLGKTTFLIKSRSSLVDLEAAALALLATQPQPEAVSPPDPPADPNPIQTSRPPLRKSRRAPKQ